MAFYRGWLNGLTLREAAELYLETGTDDRRSTRTLTWIQHVVHQTALQQGRPGEARLSRLRLGGMAQRSGRIPVPFLDEFRAHIVPYDFRGPDKLLIYDEDADRPVLDRRTQRHALLLERQTALLTWLEERLVTAPLPSDPLVERLDDNLTSRLTTAGLVTTGDLVARMADRGYHWYATVPGLGRTRAVWLVRWVQSEAATLGPLPARVLVPPYAWLPSVRPLDGVPVPIKMPDPPPVSPLVEAIGDRAAVTTWLDSCSCSTAIRQRYSKEAKRLLLWAQHERGRNLGQLTIEDAAGYQDFLAGLGRTPTAQWLFRRSQDEWYEPYPLGDSTWRPFEAPLSAHDVLYALSVVRSLYAWLAAVFYIASDPWPAVPMLTALPSPLPSAGLSPRLIAKAWAGLQAAVARLSPPFRERADALLWMAMMTGLGRTELSNARSDHLCKPAGSAYWMLKVPTKEGKWHAVPLPNEVIVRLAFWWKLRRYIPNPAALPRDLPLVGQIVEGRRDRPLAPTGVVLTVRKLFVHGQAACRAAGEPEAAAILAKICRSWARL